MSLSPLELISLIDLTSLNAEDTPLVIDELCQKAQSPFGNAAAVCVYPQFVKQARQKLPQEIFVASVVNFPDGDAPLSQVVSDIKKTVQAGADEVDVVLPYKLLKQGQNAAVIEFIQTTRETYHNKTLKIILETGALTQELIYAASEFCIAADVDFIKTSTGKIATGATPESVSTILRAIHNNKSKKTGIKISGGVRSLEDALDYAALVQKILGEEWLQAKTFRIGASKLFDIILQELNLVRR